MTTFRQARDACSGRWVSLRYALLHPLTTVIEKIRR